MPSDDEITAYNTALQGLCEHMEGAREVMSHDSSPTVNLGDCMKRVLAALAVLVILPAALGDDEVGNYDIFQLCTSVERIRLVVFETPSDAIEIGLTKKRIENVAESRLRAARIYDAEGADFLLIAINAIEPKFVSGEQIGDGQTIAVSYRLEFNKFIYERDVNRFGHAVTWTSASILMADANFTVQAISEAVDEFINEFLRVNESKECREATGKESE